MPQQRGIPISISAAFLPSEQDRQIQMILLRVLAATVSGANDDPGHTTLRALPHHCASALMLTRDQSLYTHLLRRVWASPRDVVDYFVSFHLYKHGGFRTL